MNRRVRLRPTNRNSSGNKLALPVAASAPHLPKLAQDGKAAEGQDPRRGRGSCGRRLVPGVRGLRGGRRARPGLRRRVGRRRGSRPTSSARTAWPVHGRTRRTAPVTTVCAARPHACLYRPCQDRLFRAVPLYTGASNSLFILMECIRWGG
jgi:hypothetical protein